MNKKIITIEKETVDDLKKWGSYIFFVGMVPMAIPVLLWIALTPAGFAQQLVVIAVSIVLVMLVWIFELAFLDKKMKLDKLKKKTEE